jgi:mono/diheme cytochrome c family protein
MKKLICLATTALVIQPPAADASCGVQCHQQVAFVATPYAVVTGIPVAQYAPMTYQYTPTQAPQVTVNVQLDRATMAAAFRDAIGGSDPVGPGPGPLNANNSASPPQAPLPGPVTTPNAAPLPPQPTPAGAVQANCAQCHGQNGKAPAIAKFDLTAQLTCEQRLAAMRAVLSEKMPKGRKLTPEQAGDVLTELAGK